MRSIRSFPLLLTLLVCCLIRVSDARAGRVPERIDALRQQGVRFTPVDLFVREPRSTAMDRLWASACRKADVLRLDANALERLLKARPDHIALRIPASEGDVVFELQRIDRMTADLQVRIASSGSLVEVEEGAHYRGTQVGRPGSIVAISVFHGEVMGLYADEIGQSVLGRFAQAPQGTHVWYRASDLLGTPDARCATEDREVEVGEKKPTDGAAKSIRCVNWYWETAFDIFQNKGSVQNVTTYATGLFNQTALLFDNDGVDVALQELYIWDVASPYNGTSSSSRLSQFGTTRTSFNGDLAHLLDLANYGGVAWINSLCGSTSSRMAYSGIDANYNNVPTYSWSVNVICHEQGHNLGSRHTHACAWNGDNTAIDGCGPTAGYTEGSCPTAPVPSSSVGGTIMSYCHLLSAGIKFVNGFGPQPKAVILDRVNAASCLAACGGSCDPPNGLSVSSLFATSATLQWPSLGVLSYTLRWKPLASADWTTLTGLTTNSYALTGLTPTTAYEFQVLSVCAAGSSAYSGPYGFTTPAPCPDASEPNNTLGTAAPITLPATVNALIASGSDQDHYAFSLASAATLNISLSALPANYNLALYTAGGTQVGSSTNGGTSSEFINYSAPAGNYVVRVVGSGGAFNVTQCYYLYVFSYQSQECGPVTGLNVGGLTYNAATLGWTAGLTIGSYDVRWKPVSASVWTTVTGLSVNQHVVNTLTPSTDYHFSVKPNCAGSQTGFGEPFAFTTPAAPCEVAPPILIAVKVILEGAYRSAAGLMVDSLRRQGVLPTGEPYSAIGLPLEGPTSTSAAVFSVTGNNAIVDWVVVELRTTNAPASVLERRAGLLQRDGDVVGLEGTSPLAFCSAAGSYLVSVRHRNHLGCLTASAVTLGPTVTVVDLSSASTTTFGVEARKSIGNLRALWAGNVVSDAALRYTGGSNDRDPVLQAVGNTTPNNTVTGYLVADVTLDGTVKYTGSDNDRDPILTNVGSTTPNSVRVEQLP